MFDFDKFGSAVLSAIGALILSTTFVAAAVGPARAVETTPIVYVALAANADQAHG